MKLLKMIIACSFMAQSFASAGTLLSLKREKPTIHCEVSKESVLITRQSAGIKFTKQVTYTMDDFTFLIKAAYENRDIAADVVLEHSAYLDEGKTHFYLDPKETNALKLINLLSSLCELRSM